MKMFFALALCMVISVQGFSTQIPVKLRLTDHNGQLLEGVTVKLYKQNKLIMMEENAPTIILWMLEGQDYYTVEVSRHGFVTKRLGFSTHSNPNNPLAMRYDFIITLESRHGNVLSQKPESWPPLPQGVPVYAGDNWAPSPDEGRHDDSLLLQAADHLPRF